jgi:hypothetical protein
LRIPVAENDRADSRDARGAHDRRRLSRAFPAATLSLTGTESGRTAAALRPPAGGSCRTLSSESWAALSAIAVVSGLAVATVPMRLHP